MRVNRESWHYKWKKLIIGEYNMYGNLCAYFWGCVLSIALPAIFTFLIIIVAILFIVAMFTDPLFFNVLIITIFGIGCIILPFIAIYWYRKKTIKQYLVPGEEIVIEFIKAKKNKICPLIDYY
jgi:hypothetical protein